MDKTILVIVLKNNLILVSKFTNSMLKGSSSSPDGDSILENPAIYEDGMLFKWLDGLISSNTITIYSDDILTMSTPSDGIIKKYLELFEEK